MSHFLPYKEPKPKLKTDQQIINSIEFVTGIKFYEACKKCKKSELTNFRYAYWYFMKQRTEKSLKRLGLVFKKDHATVLWGLKQADNKYNFELQRIISEVKKLINN